MNFVVAQVSPRLCSTRQKFIDVIDEKISNIIKKEGDVDLIIFPEALGLWMSLMKPTTIFTSFFSRFLHTHKQNSVRILSMSEYNPDEIVVGLQFAKPIELQDGVFSLGVMDEGLFDCLDDYKIKKSDNQRSKFENWLAKFSDFVFSKLPLQFIAQYMRSNEMLSVYKEAFSKAAKKYNVYIQAGSLFERVIGGTKNIAYTFDPDGSIVCRQEKWHPIPFEGMLGILKGSGYETFSVKGIKCGIAICNDLGFSNDLVSKLASEGCKLIAGPSGGIVPSHKWGFDYQKDVVEYQQARADESGVVVGRSYNAGDLCGILKFQGRSTIVEPGRLVAIVPEDKIKEEYNLKYSI